MDKQKVCVIKRNDEYFMEYQPDDIFIVDNIWHGRVNMISVSGVPLPLDRDERETLEDEGQPPHPIDAYSYEAGVMDCFCGMVSSGFKKLAMNHPYDTRAERDSYLSQVQRLCTRYGIRYYPEDQTLVTDLFPERVNKDKFSYLFFRTEDVSEQYMALKERQRCLTKDSGHMAQTCCELAAEFGLLLSYLGDGIARLIQEAAGGQQTENYSGVLSELENAQP